MESSITRHNKIYKMSPYSCMLDKNINNQTKIYICPNLKTTAPMFLHLKPNDYLTKVVHTQNFKPYFLTYGKIQLAQCWRLEV